MGSALVTAMEPEGMCCVRRGSSAVSGEGPVKVRRKFFRGWWAWNGLPSLKLSKYKEHLHNTLRDMGLNIEWARVEPGVGLDDTFKSLSSLDTT